MIQIMGGLSHQNNGSFGPDLEWFVPLVVVMSLCCHPGGFTQIMGFFGVFSCFVFFSVSPERSAERAARERQGEREFYRGSVGVSGVS